MSSSTNLSAQPGAKPFVANIEAVPWRKGVQSDSPPRYRYDTNSHGCQSIALKLLTVLLYSQDLSRLKAMERQRTSTYVCFDCHKHRSVGTYIKSMSQRSADTCSQCGQRMSHLGTKLQVPSKVDEKAWDELRRQYQSPGYLYTPCRDLDIAAENRHFEKCRVKKQVPKHPSLSTGCEKCDVVWQRLPVDGRDRWTRSWISSK